ncbi:MAG: class I SAM-dependent methyltransferase [Bacteroidota bacterium]|jgi:SAM-dependent methyltransferase
MNPRLQFYRKVIERTILDQNATILIIAGGLPDKEVFESLKYSNVTISNIDSRLNGVEFSPYKWSYQNAQQLTFKDNSFDFVVIHAALHHCSSPHQALLEMYRVAREEIIAFESRDSILMKIFEKLNISQTFEHAAVYANSGKYGGMNNTDIPNYVYRWTEREVEKTINAFSPFGKNKFSYWYSHDLPRANKLLKDQFLKSLLIVLLLPAYKIFTLLFKKQQNLFAFSIKKFNEKSKLHPWLNRVNGEVIYSMNWAKEKYK